jgi:phytepsin
VLDCDRLPDLPDVSFDIGGRSFQLAPEQYVLKIEAGGSAQCISGFAGLEVPPPLGPLWILVRRPALPAVLCSACVHPHSLCGCLRRPAAGESKRVSRCVHVQGDTFMGPYHTVFDYGQERVGFADAA